MVGNDSQGSPTLSSGTSAALVVGLLIIDLSNLVGNLLVFVVVFANRRLQTITNCFIMSLCLTDLLASVVLIPFAVDAILNVESFARVNGGFCDFLGFVDTVYSTTSALNAAAIALDRYQAIVNCLHYESVVTQRKAAIAMTLVWLQAGIVALCPVVGWGKYSFCTHQYTCALQLPDREGFLYFQITACILLPYVIMVFCYARIHLVARRQVRLIRVHIQVQDTRRKVVGISTQKTRQVYAVISLYALSWFPLFAIKLACSIKPSIHIPGTVTTLATILTLLSGTYNPILYALRTSQFRSGMIRIYRIVRRQFAPKRVGQGVEGAPITFSGRSRSKSASNIFQYALPTRELVRQGALPMVLAVHDLKAIAGDPRFIASSTNGHPSTLQIPDARCSKEANQSSFPVLDNLNEINVLQPTGNRRQLRRASCHV